MQEIKKRKLSLADIPFSQRKELTPAEKRRIIVKLGSILKSIKTESPFKVEDVDDDPYYWFIKEQIKRLTYEITPPEIRDAKGSPKAIYFT